MKGSLCIALLLCSVLVPTGGELVASDGCAVSACCVSMDGTRPDCCEIGEAELPRPDVVTTRAQAAPGDEETLPVESASIFSKVASSDPYTTLIPEEAPPPRDRLIELGSLLI